MKKIVKKASVIFLTLIVILAYTFVPIGISESKSALGVDTAYAGGDIDFDESILEGVNSDGTIDPGSIISFTINDLNNMDPGYSSELYNGNLKIKFCISDSLEGEGTVDKQFTSGSTFSYKVPQKYAGKYLSIWLDDNLDTHFSTNSKRYKINLVTANIIQGPSINSVQYNNSLLQKDITVNVSGYGKYNTNADASYKYVYDKKVKLWCNGVYVGEKSSSDNPAKMLFPRVPVKYNANNIIKVQIFMTVEGKEVSGGIKSYNVPGGKLADNTNLRATKINSKQAIIRWYGSAGATGYRIMMGKRKIKDVGANTFKYKVKRKGAGKGKFRVIPLFKSGGKVYTSGSGTVKPKANLFKTAKPASWRSYGSLKSRFVVKKVSLNGKKYTVKGFVYNSAYATLVKKFKKMTIAIYADGKRVAIKKYKNVKVNLKAGSQKKRTFSFKGKAGADLKNGGAYAVVTVITDSNIHNNRGYIQQYDYGF